MNPNRVASRDTAAVQERRHIIVFAEPVHHTSGLEHLCRGAAYDDNPRVVVVGTF